MHAKTARVFSALGRARVANAWLRLAACGITAAIAVSVVGTLLPLAWFAGFAAVLLTDRAVFAGVARRSEAGEPPAKLWPLVAWTLAQSVYGNLIAVMFWFAPYVQGETLAVAYMCGGLANAAATLRGSAALAAAGAGTTVAFMIGLPIADYIVGGARNGLDLLPVVAALLLLGFGVNLWRSLLASDAAIAQAEAAALRERQAAAAAAAAKSDMIQRMNDELRTPMQALVGAAEHLHRAAQNPQARAHIATLVQAGEVLKLVLDDLSDLDRLENGRLPIQPKPTDLRELVRGVVAAFRVAAHDKGLELFLDVSADTPASVEIDALRVRQILFNLLANAVRYTTHGGVRVRVHAQRGAREGVARLGFAVADTGAGMSRAQVALLFGREQAAGANGGLGLPISLKLARLMGGQLAVKSELGEGTIVSFTLDAPIAAAPGVSAA